MNDFTFLKLELPILPEPSTTKTTSAFGERHTGQYSNVVDQDQAYLQGSYITHKLFADSTRHGNIIFPDFIGSSWSRETTRLNDINFH